MVTEYLDKKGFHYSIISRNGTGNQAIMDCPFCGDTEKKFGISVENGAFNCMHKNKCGVQGSWTDFQRMLGDEPQKIEKNPFAHRPKKKVYKKPEHDMGGEDAYDWFARRAISKHIVEMYGCKREGDWIQFPYYCEGELVNIKRRKVNEKVLLAEKGSRPVLFGRDLYRSGDLCITEGEIDAMSLAQLGYQAVSVPNGASGTSWVEEEYEYLSGFTRIYLVFDTDEAGREGVRKLAPMVGLERVYDIRLAHKDANEALMAGMTAEEFGDLVLRAEDFAPSHIAYYDDLRADAVALWDNPDSLGLKTGFDFFDKHLGGWRPGEVTVVSGSAGSGKTTFLCQMITKIIRKGESVCVGSFEMSPLVLIQWIAMQNGCGPGQGEKQLDHVFKNQLADRLSFLNIQGDVDRKELFSLIRFNARKYGVRYFVIDSLMTIRINQYNELQDQRAFVAELCSVAREYGAHVFLVAHPRKRGTNEAGGIYSLDDISGSSNIVNLAHNVILLDRFTPQKKRLLFQKEGIDADAVMWILKCRYTGKHGKIFLQFDLDKKMYRGADDTKSDSGGRGEPSGVDGSSVQAYRESMGIGGLGNKVPEEELEIF